MQFRIHQVVRFVQVICTALFFFTPVIAQDIQDADLEVVDTVDAVGTMTAKGGPIYSLTENDLKERLSTLSSCVDLRTNTVVKAYIKNYILTRPEKCRNMLGKRLTYFPLFEQKFREYGLPEDLKYLSVVESALNPLAVSRVGATGLWQFMPATGSDYGLRSNSAVEDRSNPVKSTDAAARYLRDLFKQYNDWALALAAYNSGPNRVDGAIRRSGSRNFWVLMRYLPEETRNYVPAFIAATYICNYYQMHNIIANDPELDEQLTNYIKVYDGISFRDIAEATGLDYTTIKNLNPGFKRGYVPPSTDGHFVVVPDRVMPAFLRYLNSLGGRNYSIDNDNYVNAGQIGDGRYWHSTVMAQNAEHIDAFAKKFGLCGDQIKSWNKLNSNYVYKDMVLKLWRPVYVLKHSTGGRIEAPLQPKKQKKEKVNPVLPDSQSAAPTAPKPRQIIWEYHTLHRNETLEEIAQQYATTVETLKGLNKTEHFTVGMRIKVRQQ